MATINDIERLQALVDRLLPLASRSRGEVIAAEDWNTVVAALLEVAQAAVTEGAGTAVPPHKHQDQVTLAWLDPRLRTLIERGPLADPASTSRVTAIERRSALIGQQLDKMAAQVRDLRVVTSRQETNDLDRESSLTVLSRTVNGLTDPRDEISSLRASLDAIGKGVAAVSTFASGLGDVTPAALLSGLTRVGELEQRLTMPTGALLDAAEFERQLTELRTTLVTEEELTAAIRDRPARLSDAARDALLEESKVVAQRQADERASTLTEQLRGQLVSRIDEVAQSAVVAAREATDRFRGEVGAEITDQLTAVIAQNEAASRDHIDAVMGAADTALQATLDRRITQLEGSLKDRVATAIIDARPALLAAFTATLDGRVAELKEQLGTLDTRIGELGRSLTTTSTELAELRQSTKAALANQNAALRAELTANLRTAIDDTRTTQTAGLESLRAELAKERARVDDQFAKVLKRIPLEGRVITREELLSELASNNNRLRSELDNGPGRIVIRPPFDGPPPGGG